jgi:nucleoside-diphosphate-sugar epimerase
MKILIIGATGFVGTNLKQYFSNSNFEIRTVSLRDFNFKIDIQCDIVIQLAGVAHDLKKVNNSKIYYEINTTLANKLFDWFLNSEAKIYITLSSVKAVTDKPQEILVENITPCPQTHYGKSKLLAEQYIINTDMPLDKRFYILRPCMIHGPCNKGNLNLLYSIVNRGFPWPLGAYENLRSFCSIENLCFIIHEIIENVNIPSGVYNVADDKPLSTNEVISLIADSQNRKPKIWKVSKWFIQLLASLGDVLYLPLNTERLVKLTESYVVSNQKIKNAIGKPLPVSSKEGLVKTFKSFN